MCHAKEHYIYLQSVKIVFCFLDLHLFFSSKIMSPTHTDTQVDIHTHTYTHTYIQDCLRKLEYCDKVLYFL